MSLASIPGRTQLLERVSALGPDPVAGLTALAGNEGWPHADAPELAGLAHWAEQLARDDRDAANALLVLTASRLLPFAVQAAGPDAGELGLVADGFEGDGAPADEQIALAATYLADPSQENLEQLQFAYDPTRQLQVWDPDMLPPPEMAYHWHHELGQLCISSITRPPGEGDPNETAYDFWPAETCVARGMVVALRGVRGLGLSDRERIEQLFMWLMAPEQFDH